MNRYKTEFTRILVFFFFGIVSTLVSAQLDAGKAYYNKGEYAKAIETLRPVVEKTPKNVAANYYLGASYYKLGNKKASIAPLEAALNKGTAEAALPLIEMALNEYRLEDVENYISKGEDAISESKSKNKNTIANLSAIKSKALLMRNMLERVQQIEIIDSIQVDAEDFFMQYKLSSEAGSILNGSNLPTLKDLANPPVVYRNANATELFWAAKSVDDDGSFIVAASILGDGSLDNAVDVTSGMENLGKKSNSNFPFLMSDGVTLYFANDGEESIGGYDIFMTRRSDDGFLQPQNIGMPYNSPYNDYMLAIDEENGVGWWATDRNAPEGKVTIYTYIYDGDVRNNVSGSLKDAADAAKITSILSTQNPDADYDAIKERIETSYQERSDTPEQMPKFAFSLGNGKVYTSLNDFKNPEARRLMSQLLDQQQQLARAEKYLSQLRLQYANGNRSVTDKILELEQQLRQEPANIRRLSNQVIQTELSANL